METEEKGKDKYLKDIQTIKDTLIRQEKRPIVELWVFNSWTALVFTGTLIQFFINRTGLHHYDSLIFWIWIPIVSVGGILETIGWYRNTEKEGMLIKSKTNISMLHLFLIMCVSSVLLYLVITKTGALNYVPVLFLMQTGIFFTIFTFFTNTKFYFISEGFILAAIIFFIFGFEGPYADLAVGLIICLFFFAGGILYRKHTNQENK